MIRTLNSSGFTRRWRKPRPHAPLFENRPGFMDTPEGFELGEYPLGKDHWIEGYISADEALRDFEA